MKQVAAAFLAAAVALSSPAFAAGFSNVPLMPTLTFPSDNEVVTQADTKLLGSCDVHQPGDKTCIKALDDTASKRVVSDGK